MSTLPDASPAHRLTVATRAAVPPFHVMDLLAASAARQRTHGDVVNLLAGQPSAGAPKAVSQEAIRLLQDGGSLGYTPSTGIAPRIGATPARKLSRGSHGAYSW